MQNPIKDTISSVLIALKNIIVFLAEHLGKENGIRSLYLVILTIPSICLLWLYNRELDNNAKLNIQLISANREAKKNYMLYVTAKDSIRKTIIDEYVHLSKAMNNLKTTLNESNDVKAKAIEKYTTKVDNEINKIE